MAISQTTECEGVASSIFSAAKLSLYLEGESDWTIPVMPKWARSSSPSYRAMHDISKMIGTLEDDYYNIDEAEDDATKRTIANLKEAAKQLSPPRFGAEYKLHKKAQPQQKPTPVSQSIPRVYKLIPGSSVWSVSEDIAISASIQESHVNSTSKAEISLNNPQRRPETPIKSHLNNTQQCMNEPKCEAPVSSANILEANPKPQSVAIEESLKDISTHAQDVNNSNVTYTVSPSQSRNNLPFDPQLSGT